MKSPQGGRLFELLRRMAAQPDVPEVSDADLLSRFVQARDEMAFEAVVRRHGPMALAVCRRRLGNDADAEDAFRPSSSYWPATPGGSAIASRSPAGCFASLTWWRSR
jgi:hypothetical protein